MGLGELVSQFKSSPGIQKVLLTIQNDHASSMISKQAASSIVEPGSSHELKTVCTPDSESRSLTRLSVESQVRCDGGHGFVVMDPLVWSRFPDELLELVLAWLPLSQMSLVPCISKAWLAKSQTPSFRRMCAATQSNSKLFGILGYHYHHILGELLMTAFDVNAHKWYNRTGVKDPWGNRKSLILHAHDGGLVCCVPEFPDYSSGSEVLPIVVGNPLTNMWESLPLINFRKKEPILVQLVRDAETGCYRVMLVYRDKIEGNHAAECYDSKTRLWSTLNSGHVYGSEFGEVFDCEQRVIFNFSVPPLESEQFVSLCHAFLGDRVFVVHECAEPRQSGYYDVTEFATQCSTSLLSRKLKSYECPLQEMPEEDEIRLFASNGFLLLVVDHTESEGECRLVLSLFDIAAEVWRDVPARKGSCRIGFPESDLVDILLENLYTFIMCELRWDAFP